MAMKNSVSSRIKITRTGKVLRRSMGIGHFRTRKSSKNLLGKLTRKGLNVSAQTLRTY